MEGFIIPDASVMDREITPWLRSAAGFAGSDYKSFEVREKESAVLLP